MSKDNVVTVSESFDTAMAAKLSEATQDSTGSLQARVSPNKW
jgi:hypothetical protein